MCVATAPPATRTGDPCNKMAHAARWVAALRTRFDRTFRHRTGFVTLDRLLKRLHAYKAEFPMVLDL